MVAKLVFSDTVCDKPKISSSMFTSDAFFMYVFKVRRCALNRSHDWTECPYAHPGEKARRRDPRKYFYSGDSCSSFNKGRCTTGDACEYAHGVFECWLHPSRYRTQWCKDGAACPRSVCFFAHTFEQLRLSGSTEFRPLPRRMVKGNPPLASLPTSTLMSPALNLGLVDQTVWAFQNLQVRLVTGRPGFDRNRYQYQYGVRFVESSSEGESVMEKVESGRNLRAKVYEKLTRQNSLRMK